MKILDKFYIFTNFEKEILFKGRCTKTFNSTLLQWKKLSRSCSFYCLAVFGSMSMHYSGGLQQTSSKWVVTMVLSWRKFSYFINEQNKNSIFLHGE